MVRTRSGASSRALDDSVDLSRRPNVLGSLPSGDLDVRDERVAKLAKTIAELSPRKPGARIFDLIDQIDSGDQSAYETPPLSPTPGEDVYEGEGMLDNEYSVHTEGDPPGLSRTPPPIDFALARAWNLGDITEAARAFEFYRVEDERDPTSRKAAIM